MVEPIVIQFGRNVAIARVNAGLTQEQLYRLCGIHPTEISRILAMRPGVIVTADHAMTVQRDENLSLIRNATETDYRPLITASLHDREVTAWVRRDLARR